MLEWSCLMIELYHHSWNLIWHMRGLSQSETRQERPGQSMEEVSDTAIIPKLVSVVARATESYRNERKRKTSTWTHGHMETAEGLFRGVPSGGRNTMFVTPFILVHLFPLLTKPFATTTGSVSAILTGNSSATKPFVFGVVVDASTLLLSVLPRHRHLQNRKTNCCGNQIMP